MCRGNRPDLTTGGSAGELRGGGLLVDTRTGVRAGQLLSVTDSGPEFAVDAFIVAVADLVGDAVVATVDTTDLRRPAEYATKISVVDVDE